MENSNNKKLKELEQEELINSILSKSSQNNQFVVNAYVEATKQRPNKSNEDIEKRKNQIINRNLERQHMEYRRKVDDVKSDMLLSRIDQILEELNDEDGILAKWDEEERKRKEERRKHVDEIIKQSRILEKKNANRPKTKKELDATTLQKDRAKYNIKQEKKLSLWEQLQRLLHKEKVEKHEAQIEASKQQAAIEKARKELAIKKATKAIEVASKQFGVPVKQTTSVNNEPLRNSFENNKMPKTILGIKQFYAAKVYQQAMDSYASRGEKPLFDVRIGKPSSTSLKGKTFADSMHCKVDEKKAQNDALRKAANSKISRSDFITK